MIYAILNETNDAIVNHGTARQLWPNTSFRGGPNEVFLQERNAVKVRYDLAHDDTTHYLQQCEPYLLNGQVYGVEVLPIPPAPVEPQWLAFGFSVMTDPDVNALQAAAAQAGLYGIVGGLQNGLSLAANGERDPRVFLGTWTLAYQMGLISAALVAKVQAMAVNFDIPADFIAGLDVEASMPQSE